MADPSAVLREVTCVTADPSNPTTHTRFCVRVDLVNFSEDRQVDLEVSVVNAANKAQIKAAINAAINAAGVENGSSIATNRIYTVADLAG